MVISESLSDAHFNLKDMYDCSVMYHSGNGLPHAQTQQEASAWYAAHANGGKSN